MKRICEWAMALLFSGVLLVLMAATILLPKNRYSYYENRNLSAFPEITAESVLSGQVFDDLETLFCDYAAWRTPALKAVTWADLNVFRRPVVNETVVTDDVLLPQLYDPAMSDDDIRAQAKLVAEDNAALQKQVESYGGHYCYVAVPCQYVYYEDSYPAYLTNRSHYTDLELSALTEEMNAQGVCFLDMGPVFDSLGHPPEFSSRVDNHYGLLGAYETYRAAVQKINGDYGLALSFPEEGTDVTFSALPNPYMGSRTRKLLGLRGDDEKLLTAAFREDIPFTRGRIMGKLPTRRSFTSARPARASTPTTWAATSPRRASARTAPRSPPPSSSATASPMPWRASPITASTRCALSTCGTIRRRASATISPPISPTSSSASAITRRSSRAATTAASPDFKQGGLL